MADGIRRRLDADLGLDDLFIEFLDSAQQELKIVDIGAGPLTWVGRRWGERQVTVRAVDALADDYAAIFDEAGVKPPVRTEQCLSEELSAFFPADEFDLSFARNTLDHSVDPLKAIRGMAHITRPGGIVLLQHAENEGKEHEYSGLHQWNFTEGAGAFLVWNSSERIDVSRSMADTLEPARIWRESHADHELIFAAFRRR